MPTLRSIRVARNNGENALHGGLKGFDKVLWSVEELSGDAPGIQLKYRSVDGEEGYPGTLDVLVRYTLNDKNELRIDYEAQTDQETVLNLTNHSYFDLSGAYAGRILDIEVMLNADHFTPVNAHLIPTGEVRPVAGTPFDFRVSKKIGRDINAGDEQLRIGLGYDHNYVLNRSGSGLTPAARAYDPESGRILEVETTQPGMQFYTGNHLDGSVKGRGGVIYGPRTGFCFETQHYPDSPNQPSFPTSRLKPGEEYRHTTVFRCLAD